MDFAIEETSYQHTRDEGRTADLEHLPTSDHVRDIGLDE